MGVLFAAQLTFFWEFDRYGHIDLANRIAIATIIFLISLIGGRIIPSFTGNWRRQNNQGAIPPAFNRFDLGTMVLSGVALAAWPIASNTIAIVPIAGILLIIAAIAQFLRQLRWKPERTLAEPLVTILHVAFFFVPLGFLLNGAAFFLDDASLGTAGVHAWTSGAIGIMTLAVMTRATRGHSGQALHSPASTTFGIYVPIVLAAILRIAAALAPEHTMILLPLAGLLWITAFLSFVGFYGPLVLRRKVG